MSLLLLFNNNDSLPEENISLYISGYLTDNNNTTLFINGHEPVNNGVDLYVSGFMIYDKTLNLSVNGKDIISPANNAATLVINGTTPGIDGMEGAITLFLDSSHSIGYLNLTLFSDLPGESVKSMNLFTKGYFLSSSNSIPLVLFNDNPLKTTTLFIKGDGITAGALPVNGSMNLFINRGIGDAISLFLNAAPPTSNIATLYTAGAFLLNGSVTLAMSQVIGQEIKTVKLYTHGF